MSNPTRIVQDIVADVTLRGRADIALEQLIEPMCVGVADRVEFGIEINQRLGVRIPYRALVAFRTVGDLAQWVEDELRERVTGDDPVMSAVEAVVGQAPPEA